MHDKKKKTMMRLLQRNCPIIIKYKGAKHKN